MAPIAIGSFLLITLRAGLGALIAFVTIISPQCDNSRISELYFRDDLTAFGDVGEAFGDKAPAKLLPSFR
jgi:hypothetical protein